MLDAALYALPANAVVQAGAGTGKTHSLVTLCLHLLGGVGRAAPLEPAALWAVTFTEKAAAELQARLRQRIDALAEGRADERELVRSCEQLGQPPPGLEVWRRARRDLGLAQVGTIHALCGQILRRHAPSAGLDPRFEVLDERDAARLLQDSAEATVLRALDGAFGDDLRQAARRLCAELGFRSKGKFGSGLADEIRGLLARLGESGTTPEELVARSPGLDPAVALEADLHARRDLEAAAVALERALPGARGSRKTDETAREMVRCLRGGGLAALAEAKPGGLAQAWPALRGAWERSGGTLGGPLEEPVRAARTALKALREADVAFRASGLSRDLAALATRALSLVRAEKERRGALDFDDLTRLARDLLVRHPAAREAERARVGVLLVDEFQDTSRTQLELFSWLAGSGEPGPARPGALVVVGDRKQSIYEFRGADVASAQAFAEATLRDGGRRYLLSRSRRSRPALVRFGNLLFRGALASREHAFDTPFSADDALDAHRPDGPAGACAELLQVSGKGVEAEAEVVARRVASLLLPGAPERVFDAGEEPRPVRGGDVALLFRRFTNLETFRRALLRWRIPHLVYKGRGFHESREILDLVALLTLAVDPGDALSLAAVLRSPLGPVSDDALALLSRGRRLTLSTLSTPEGLAADDVRAVERVRTLVERMQREADRLGPVAILEGALAATDYVAACAGGLYGEQAAANVDKLTGMARAAELRGEGLRPFLRSLRMLADEEAREPDAPVVEERDPHAVRLMTVHAAKGLEFPVVVIPECASFLQPGGPERTLLDPDLGLAVKARDVDRDWCWAGGNAEVAGARKAREAAQARRLLYVAITRARDFVVLSGTAAQRQDTWRKHLDAVAEEAAARGLLSLVTDGPALAKPERLPAPVDDAALAALAAGELDGGAQAPAPLLGRARSISAAVTQIADAAACARRYQLLHELRLEERPDADPALPDPLGPEPGERATALGALAHRLLELVPLGLDRAARRAELERLMRLEGEDPTAHAQVLDAAAAFLDSPLGVRMAKAGSRLQRELPFTLRLQPAGDGPVLFLRGQIDALLVDDTAATVVDYKLSREREPERYSSQLDAYALAAHELVQGTVGIRTGIVFLRSPGAPYVERPPTKDLSGVRERLLEAAKDIAEGRKTGTWAKIEPARCRAIGCGFLPTCHPREEPSGS